MSMERLGDLPKLCLRITSHVEGFDNCFLIWIQYTTALAFHGYSVSLLYRPFPLVRSENGMFMRLRHFCTRDSVQLHIPSRKSETFFFCHCSLDSMREYCNRNCIGASSGLSDLTRVKCNDDESSLFFVTSLLTAKIRAVKRPASNHWRLSDVQDSVNIQ
jgi:hypothetical protein